MISLPVIVLLAACGVAAYIAGRRMLARRREAHIAHYALPPGLHEKVMRKHPQLTKSDMELVSRGLRQFFLAHLHSGRQHVSMPSQVVDDLWHEFILYTRHYQQPPSSGFPTP